MRVLTLGTFDLFHAGHVNLLRRCAELGEVTVGLNTDSFVERYKGKPPVVGFEDRRVVLESCRFVDEVVPNAQANGSAWDVITESRPDAIVVGSDWADRDYLNQLGITGDDLGDIRLVYVPYTLGISSTAIRARLS